MGQTFRADVFFEGKNTQFLLNDISDEMQRYPAHGKFYEHDQLIVHRQLIPKEGMAIIDVGSNIGNHALFYSVHTDARKIFCFEPNPIACALLRKNVEINSETKIDLTYAEYGCGDERQRCRVVQMPGNLGGATLKADDSGDGLVDVMPLDSILLNEPISFIKIDVEGMELNVLGGASAILHRYRPCIAVEVMNENHSAFWTWCVTNNYHILHAFRMYWSAMNYVCVPKTKPVDTVETQAELHRFWKSEYQDRRRESLLVKSI